MLGPQAVGTSQRTCSRYDRLISSIPTDYACCMTPGVCVDIGPSRIHPTRPPVNSESHLTYIQLPGGASLQVDSHVHSADVTPWLHAGGEPALPPSKGGRRMGGLVVCQVCLGGGHVTTQLIGERRDLGDVQGSSAGTSILFPMIMTASISYIPWCYRPG